MHLSTTAFALAVNALLCVQAQDARTSKFLSLAAKHGGVVPLDSKLYDELVGSTASSPRNYTASVILTALPANYGCQPCRNFDKEHSVLAKQWWTKSKKGKAGTPHFFGVLDFPAGQDVFRRVSCSTHFICVGIDRLLLLYM